MTFTQRLLKTLDRIVGTLGTSLAPTPEPISLPLKISKILFIRPGGIGDAVLLISVINAVKEAYPGSRIEILAERRNADAFLFTEHVDRVHCYDKCSGLISALNTSYDVVIDTEQWYRLSAMVARVVRAPTKIGFATNERRKLFNYSVSYADEAYEAENFMRLCEPLGVVCQYPSESIHLTPPLAAAGAAENLLHSYATFVAIFPGASMPEKQWSVLRFHQVAEYLNQMGFAVVVIGGKSERAIGDLVMAGVSGLNLAGKASLTVTGAVIARAKLLISGDSGVLHIAAGFVVPTVALFGPSSIAKWAPRGNNHRVVTAGSVCAPCSRYGTIPPCCQKDCMEDITVDQVVLAIESVITNLPGRKKQ